MGHGPDPRRDVVQPVGGLDRPSGVRPAGFGTRVLAIYKPPAPTEDLGLPPRKKSFPTVS